MLEVKVFRSLDMSISVTLLCVYIYWCLEKTMARRVMPCWGSKCHYRHHLKRLTQRSVDAVQTEIQDNIIKTRSSCSYPCACSTSDAGSCKTGIPQIKDGCDCCYMCARQQGDLCDYQARCDDGRGLYCDFSVIDGEFGICRAKSAIPCDIDGQIYKDGEEFSPECDKLCTCQNGIYSCTTLCPEENMAPSKLHCPGARLVTASDLCCKQWICPTEQDHSFLQIPHYIDETRCDIETTPWTACSVTCGMGESLRVSNDNPQCHPIQQRRLCIVRPCGLADQHMRGRECRSTWRSEAVHIRTEGCSSVSKYRPKYCSTCKRNKCCEPAVTRTASIKFTCSSLSPKQTATFVDSPLDHLGDHPLHMRGERDIMSRDLRRTHQDYDNRTYHESSFVTMSGGVDINSTRSEHVISRLFMWIQSCDCHVTDICSYS